MGEVGHKMEIWRYRDINDRGREREIECTGGVGRNEVGHRKDRQGTRTDTNMRIAILVSVEAPTHGARLHQSAIIQPRNYRIKLFHY